MKIRKTDPLLLIAKAIVVFMIAALGFAAVMLTIGFFSVLTVGRNELFAKLAETSAPTGAFWGVVGAIGLIVTVLALSLWFLATLWAVIRSVDHGNVFELANAQRLAKMGWLSLAAQLIAVPLGVIVVWLSPYAADFDEITNVNVDFGGGGLVLTLVLFILARVFRNGAAMRADLEGTV